MTDFVMSVVVPLADDSVDSAVLGASNSTPLKDKDIGKALKLAGDSRYVVASADDEIEGVLLSVEPHTVNGGYGFGSVQKKERFVAINANASAALAVGAYVVAGTQAAVGTELPTISTGTQTGVRATPVKAGSPTKFLWRVVSLLGGNGAVGTTLLIERA